MTILYLNGPPRSGKDTLAKILKVKYEGTIIYPFARELKERVNRAYELDLPWDHFEDRKDEPALEFLGQTPRKVWIQYSEHFMKPLHGRNIFGRLWIEAVECLTDFDDPEELIIIPDSGFPEEVDYVARTIHERYSHAQHLVRMAREGCSFKGDSRSYLHFKQNVYWIDSDQEIENTSLETLNQILLSYTKDGYAHLVERR